MSNWREQLGQFAIERGLRLTRVNGGLCIDFPDGCDAFWILPGEVTSSLPLDEPQIDVPHLISEFQRVAELRRQVIHVVTHYLASIDIAFDREANGHWPIAMAGGASSSIDLGPTVSAGALDGLSVHQLVARCFEGHWIRHGPSPRRMDRYLSTEGLPPKEKRVSEKPATAIIQGIRGAVGAMRVCGALKVESNLESPEKLKESVAEAGPISIALLHTADRLPDVKASLEITTGNISVDFDDRLVSFRIDVKMREFIEKVRSSGPEAAGDWIADEYLRLNRDRSALLNAVKRAASQRGWKFQRLNTMSQSRTWCFGSQYRDVTLRVDSQLTEQLRSDPPDKALRALLSNHADFAEECVSQLNSDESIDIEAGELSPFPPDDRPALRELDSSLIAKIDAIADEEIAKFLESDRAIYSFKEEDLYVLNQDAWMTSAAWVRIAEKHIGGKFPNATAIAILLNCRDSRGEALALDFLNTVPSHHEVDSDAIMLAWRFRHQISEEIVRKWFCPALHDPVPFSETRAKLGDPVALRFESFKRPQSVETPAMRLDRDPDIGLLENFTSQEKTEIHQRLLHWAKTSWSWPLKSVSQLRWATALGFEDVADALNENPFLTNQMLRAERRYERLDEPGIFMGGQVFLAWSRLNPTPLMAQLIATALTTDLITEAMSLPPQPDKKAPRKRSKPGVFSTPDGKRQLYERLMKQARFPLAVAWKRWRLR